MVIVNRYLSKQTKLVCVTVVLGVELTVGNCGCLEVGRHREFEYVLLVNLNTAVLVGSVTNELDVILGVVLEVVVSGIKLDLNRCGTNSSAVTERLSYVVVGGFKDQLTRLCVRDRYNDLICVSECACPYEAE